MEVFLLLGTSLSCFSHGTFRENSSGQLGLGNTESIDRPRQVDVKNIVFVACGSEHTAAINNLGHLFTWGKGSSGQLVGECSWNVLMS